jgi:hypothetical protein
MTSRLSVAALSYPVAKRQVAGRATPRRRLLLRQPNRDADIGNPTLATRATDSGLARHSGRLAGEIGGDLAGLQTQFTGLVEAGAAVVERNARHRLRVALLVGTEDRAALALVPGGRARARGFVAGVLEDEPTRSPRTNEEG